jgi:hypothetical protein
MIPAALLTSRTVLTFSPRSANNSRS